MIKELTKFIATKTGLTVGTSIYAGHRPPTAPEACDVVIIRDGSVLFCLPSQIEQDVQIISRAKSLPEAERRAYAIHNVLSRLLGGYSVASVDGLEIMLYINVIETQTPPSWIGVDDRGLHEYSINYTFRLSSQGAGT